MSGKIFSIFLAGLMICLLAACGSTGETKSAETAGSQAGQAETAGNQTGQAEAAGSQTGQAETADNQTGQMEAAGSQTEAGTPEQAGGDTVNPPGGTLVVYFSRTGEQYGGGVIEKGNTEIVADMIIEKTGADSFEIRPADDNYPYTYDELTDIAKREQNERARPAYAGEAPDLSGYSVVYIGAPVWWGDWPMIMYTFFEENADALAGKTLVPFSTHAGSGLAGFDTKLAAACPGSTVGKGLAISGTDAQNDQDSVRSAVSDWIAGR